MTSAGSDLSASVDRWLEQHGDGLIALRRELHANPEISGAEYATTRTVADHLDLAGDALDTLVQPQPVFVEADNQIVHARRYLVGAVLQDGKERIPQGMGASTNRYALFDQESADLIDCRRSSRDQP